MNEAIEDLGQMTEVVEQLDDGDLTGVAQSLAKLSMS